MSTSLESEAVHRSSGGLQQWSEYVAFGWLFHHQARNSSCDRPIATDAAAQPVPPVGLHQFAAAQAGQADCRHREHSAPSPLPASPPPAHCQPGGGTHGEQPDEPGPAALHDGDDPPQPHRDQEQTDAASQQTAQTANASNRSSSPSPRRLQIGYLSRHGRLTALPPCRYRRSHR